MRVLVTGASGGLAPFVIRALWERHEVVLMSRRPPQAACATLPWVRGDITVFADCQRAVQGIDAMQHLAAQPWPVDHPRLRGQATAQGVPFDATFQSTLLGTYDLMQAAVAAGVEQVIMAGSHCALGHGSRISQTPFPFQALPIDASHPAFPEDASSYSTLAGELLLASPDVEWTAVCTSRPESAEEARCTFGAKLAFHDYREMVASPAIDAVAVVVRVPEHYGPTEAAIEAGKQVYTE